MFTVTQKRIVTDLVNECLDNAERVWDEVGYEMRFEEVLAVDSMIKKADVVPSKIPGHEFVTDGKPLVSNFIALVADMRGSSNHLLQRISEKTTSVTQLQRVYYETAALLPALAKAIAFKGGAVTEYLGDGVLSLFQVDADDPTEALYASHAAAKNCIGDVRTIVNEALKIRYNLPALQLGVGLSTSKALVTLVGLDGEKQAKAVGECVYRASKLSSGIDEIIVDESMRNMWPKEKGGSLMFTPKAGRNGVIGYVLGSKA